METKKAIIKFEEHLYDIKNLSPSNIAIGHSSTQLANDLFNVLMNPGDSILLLDPSYCNYPTQVLTAIHDIKILRFPVIDIKKWKYDAESKIEEFKEFILENKPKVTLLIVPDNPSSQILSHDFVQTVLDAVSETGGFLIIDFAYREIVFRDKYPEYFSWSPMDNYIALHSNSKWCRSLGRRMGWIKAPEFVIEALESMLNSSILCPDTLHQMAFVEYVDVAIRKHTLKPYLKKISRQYESAAERTVKAIEKYLGLPCFIPQGGLYTCVNVGMNSAQFTEDVLKAASVLLVPGWGFGRTMADAVRISYGPLVNEPVKIEKGIERIGEYLNAKDKTV